jgi:hypothetical protein
MASLTVTQPTGQGIKLKFTYAPNGGVAAATGTVWLGTTGIDNQGFYSTDFVYTDNVATITLSDAALVKIYTQSKVSASNYLAPITMRSIATNVNGDVISTSAFTGVVSNVLSYSTVPLTPTISSVSGQDGYISLLFTVDSTPAPTVLGGNTYPMVDIIVQSTDNGIETYTIQATSSSNIGSLFTLSVQTDPISSPQINSQQYEVAVRLSNTNGISTYSDTVTVIPSNVPNSITDVTINTAYSSGTTLHATNSATYSAKWLDADAQNADADGVVVRWGVLVGGEFANTGGNDQTATTTIATENLVNYTTVATSLPVLPIPRAWFTAAYNGTDVTQLEIVARMEQTTNGTTLNAGNTSPVVVYDIQLPTIGDISIIGVTSDGLQTFNMVGTGQATDGTPTMTSTYNGVSVNRPLTYDAVGNTYTITDHHTLDYATVDAGSNGILTHTVSLPDANNTVLLGGTPVEYTASVTQSLHAFKHPVTPTVTIVGGEVTIAPTITVTDQGDMFGYTLDSYTVSVFDNLDDSYVTYTNSSATAASIVATSNGSAYRVGDYHVTYTKNLSGIPAVYNGTYPSAIITGHSGVTGNASASALYYINPTITGVTVTGANMVVVGNTGGSLFNTDCITSVGFISGGTDFNLSTATANMDNTLTSGNEAAYAYSVTLTHTGDLLLNKMAGDTFDGLAFVNSNNANSALSIVN